MKKFLMILLIIVVLLVVGRNFVVDFGIKTGVKLFTGLNVSIGKINLGLMGTDFLLKDFKLYNPIGFKDRVMVDIPEVYVNYAIQPLFKGKVNLDELRFHLKEFAVIKKEDGKVNIDSLKQPPKKEEAAPKEEKPKGKPPEIFIGKLSIKIDKVVTKEYSADGKDNINEYNLNIDEQYENVDNLVGVGSMIAMKVVANTSLAALTNIDLGALEDSVKSVGAAGAKAVSATADKTKEVAGATADKTKEVVGSAQDSLKQGASKLKGLFNKGE